MTGLHPIGAAWCENNMLLTQHNGPENPVTAENNTPAATGTC